jgi:two-component system, NtrC family, sensor kinase
MRRPTSLQIFCMVSFWYLFGFAGQFSFADSTKNNTSSEQFPVASDRYDSLCIKAEQAADADSIILYSDAAILAAGLREVNPSRALILKGNGYHLSGKLTLAVECFTQAAKMYQDDNNLIGIATAYTYLASAYISQQNHNNAKHYLKRAIQIFDLESDSVRLASAMHNLGYEHYRIGQYDSALVLFAASGDVYRQLQFESENAYCIGNTGLVYSKMNDLGRAEKHLVDAITILEKHSDAFAVADFTNEYAFVLQRKGKINKALQHAYKGFGIASSNNITELKRDAAYRLSQIYEEMRRYDSAFHYQLIYFTYSDSIRNIESIQKTADLRTEFEVAQKQAEVDVLEKNKTLQRVIIGSLALVILLAIGLIVLIYVSLNRTRKLSADLEERQKQLEKQSYELMELNHIKDRFFSIISHDLRTPIASLSGISYLLTESIERDNKAILLQATDYIDQSVVTLTELLENLLNWALSQQGKFPVKEELIDLKQLISEVVKIFSSVALSKNQHLHLDIQAGLCISADKNSMMTILCNLVSNALKFTPKEGEIIISAQQKDEDIVEICVSDNGIGIPENKIDELFTLKADKSARGTNNEKGIGLGLTLVRDFVTLNKGNIQVISKVGEGTSFILHFPLKLHESQPINFN